ncbi:unnamed protein product [Haemonchus placei]|uniref:SCP domain-containing protein n=1 Tax=Haemonchus placei TaxID=6290 RepID=A0A0N4WQH9_HAEPC|nr:unnamed protein product [Haemonchus placei]
MLVVFTALVCILGNVVSQGQENPLPEAAEQTFKTLNMQYNEDLIWSNEWAKKALEWLNSKESVKADVIVKGKESFPKADNKSLEEQLLLILRPIFEKRKKEINNLPKFSIYGCNFIVNPKGNEDSIRVACLYMKLPLIVTHNVPQGSEAPLPKELETTFKRINSKYSNKTEWSVDWAKKALEWLKSPESVEADAIIKGKMLVSTFLYHSLACKNAMLNQVEDLPEGTVYGCNGVLNTMGKKKDFIYTACLYKKP